MFKNYTILLVEDNIDMQKYMKKLLEDECKEFFLADDGEEGLSVYKEKKPDLIITDLNMPKMDGIQMSKKIKEDNFLQPIILLTAYGDIRELQEAINIGLNAFLSKPIEDIEILFNTITKIFYRFDQHKEKEVDKNSKVNEELNNSIKKLLDNIDSIVDEDSKKSEDLKLESFISDILHDDVDYFDYESLKNDIPKVS